MGKSLIIKGADFSVNAIPLPQTQRLALAQGTIGAGTEHGNWDYSDESYNSKRLKSAKTAGIFVEQGKSVQLNGLTGLGYGYFPYSQNNPTPSNVLAAQYCQTTPVLNTNNDNVITWTNNTGQDVYVWFIFKWLGTDGTHAANSEISPSDVRIVYEVFDS